MVLDEPDIRYLFYIFPNDVSRGASNTVKGIIEVSSCIVMVKSDGHIL